MWDTFNLLYFMFNILQIIFGSDTSSLYNDRLIIAEKKTGVTILDTFNEWYLSSNVIKENM